MALSFYTSLCFCLFNTVFWYSAGYVPRGLRPLDPRRPTMCCVAVGTRPLRRPGPAPPPLPTTLATHPLPPTPVLPPLPLTPQPRLLTPGWGTLSTQSPWDGVRSRHSQSHTRGGVRGALLTQSPQGGVRPRQQHWGGCALSTATPLSPSSTAQQLSPTGPDSPRQS